MRLHHVLIAPMAFGGVEDHSAFKAALAERAKAFGIDLDLSTAQDRVVDALHRHIDPYRKRVLENSPVASVKTLSKDGLSASLYMSESDDALVKTTCVDVSDVAGAFSLHNSMLERRNLLNSQLQKNDDWCESDGGQDGSEALFRSIQSIAKTHGFPGHSLTHVYASTLLLVHSDEYDKASTTFMPFSSGNSARSSRSHFNTNNGITVVNDNILKLDSSEWIAYEIRLQILLNRAFQISSFLETNGTELSDNMYYLSRIGYSSVMAFTSRSPMPELIAIHEAALKDTGIKGVATTIARRLVDVHEEATTNATRIDLKRMEDLRTKEKRFENIISLLVSLGVASTIVQTFVTIETYNITPNIHYKFRLTYFVIILLIITVTLLVVNRKSTNVSNV